MIAGLSEDAKYVGMYVLLFFLFTISFTSWISFEGGTNSLHSFSDFLFKLFDDELFLLFVNDSLVTFDFYSLTND